ncbi:hypothetical protein [Gluconacetobacter diazotrophicus]|uniref:Uncharacterized protein n=2 Tax=Gluconacetobacter diazotrophicus TaxID=33996 RepID=A9HE70_GLUDA|nr:hypothetical protein [Gluconacetobacter diazotrophicus]MBB2155240.1 hypothetical protein [Gluconacetobacter diazotrophicus]CAP55192.1 hypothetical protein GDI1249 [Gluconacetobacter diazotrophicus PA1 5]
MDDVTIEGMVKNGYRVRPTGLRARDTGRMIFRIDDARGRPVARIAASDAMRALALFWRRRGGQTLADILPRPGPHHSLGATLRRSIDMARIRAGTGELPLPAIETPEARRKPPRARAVPAAPRAAAEIGQDDLFTRPPAAIPEPVAPEPVAPAPPRRRAEHLDAESVQLARVHYRGLQSSDPADSYLYHIATGRDAEAMLRDGLAPSRRNPLLLTERGGVPYWLAVLADDADMVGDEAADIAVLRMKRFMIDDLIEDDPDSTRSSGSPCYFLTGNV